MIPIIHIALYVLYLILFLWIICRWSFFKITAISTKQLGVFFLLKVIAGIVFTLIYTHYYTDTSKADIYRYFNDSKVISNLLFQQPLVWLRVITGFGLHEPEVFRHLMPTLYFSHPESDIATNNTLIIRTISVFNYFSFYNIYIDTLFFNFLSFIGLTALFKAVKKYFEEFPQLLLIPVYLLPSVVLWGSGMLKEQFAFTFIGVFFYLSFVTDSKGKWKRVIVIALLWYVVYCIKPSIAACLLASLPFLPIVNISPVRKVSIVLVVPVLLGIILFILKPDWGNDICEQLISKRNEFILLAMAENSGSYFDKNISATDCTHLFLLIPKGLCNSILRPFIWEGGNLFQTLFAIENLLFFILILFLLFRFFKLPSADKLLPALAFFTFALLNYLIIGITVPITGAIVHYRIIATPFLFMSILFVLNQVRLKTFAVSLKNYIRSLK